MTVYVVLRRTVDHLERWDRVPGTFGTTGARAAVREAIRSMEKPANRDGTYVAVPESSWQPAPFEVELTIRLKGDTPDDDEEPL